MYINHNQMATNVANTLTGHYSDLQTSTKRLSTGLRVNSAADDAAGLAIRELMRTDITALQQGVRNANDAISLIQTADGALGVIDEKLTRMKELAEQAATGTYDSTQRLMIESEYQAMASEITRIANSTDFNGIHLLNGNLSSSTHNGAGMTSTGKMKIHFGTGNDSAEDYYYIQIGNCTASALGLGNASTLDAGHDISTQENAQKALEAITAAIVSKDNIRAHLGAIQNRLENTITNLSIQAENLQAAESRISDVDVATEMTQFVRNQILTQSAVAMLSQANSMPQMACSLSADNVTNPRGEGNDRHGARPSKPPRRRKAASDMSPSSPIRTPYAHIKSPRGRKHLCGPRYTLYRPQDAGQAGKNRPGGSRRRHRVPGGSLSARYRAESGRAANPQ